MQIKIDHNFPDVQRAINQLGPKVLSAAREGINRTVDAAKGDVVREIGQVFDRPDPLVIRSPRVTYAKSGPKPEAVLWLKQRGAERDKLWARPQIAGGARDTKPMEQRLQAAGFLPAGWLVVPGEAAPLDAYGNISRGELARIFRVLDNAGPPAPRNVKLAARLRKGSVKKGVEGFAYFVNPVGAGRARHLQPGVYRRVYTGTGTVLKPMLIFVSNARYRARLDFYGVVQRSVRRNFSREFDVAMRSLVQTGSASGLRRGRQS
jgi:hypothetical protein